MKLVVGYAGCWWVGCYIWYSPSRPLRDIPNVTAHPSTASVPITVLLYNGPLLCSFNVPMKGLKYHPRNYSWRCWMQGVGRGVWSNSEVTASSWFASVWVHWWTSTDGSACLQYGGVRRHSHWVRRSVLRRLVTLLLLGAGYKYSYLLTYLLTWCFRWKLCLRVMLFRRPIMFWLRVKSLAD